MDAIEERIRQAAKEEARQEANKEVMTMVGSMLAAIQAGGGAMPVINKIDVAVAAGTKSISDEESENYEEDEALVQNALRWMVIVRYGRKSVIGRRTVLTKRHSVMMK